MSGNVEALPAIEESKAQKIGPEEAPQRPQSKVKKTGSAVFSGVLAHKFIAKVRDLPQSPINAVTAEVEKIAPKFAHVPRHLNVRVRINPRPAALSTAPDSD